MNFQPDRNPWTPSVYQKMSYILKIQLVSFSSYLIDGLFIQLFIWLYQNRSINTSTLGVHQKVTHTKTNLHLSATSLFKYVWPFCGHQAL